ncbi:MAG TPA: tetratricopeptide repeat protein [Longimicrobium sp.]|nr:tetratricopeptide repeat protein [Longimicrobium sp.]
MKSTRSKTAQARPPRRWRTPPPLTRGSAETLEGMEILREVGGESGLLLWQSYRNVMFWATAEPEERAALFAPEAGRRRLAELLTADVPGEIADSLVEIGQMMDAPEATTGESIANATRSIADWAERAGHEATALAYTQAAALSAPRDATIALAVGQIARRRGEQARAETWFRHAIMIGRQTGDWESYARAYIALGNMLLQRGNFPGAHRMHIKALRAARRKGLTPIQGMAAHDLFVIATETGRNAQAEEYARRAMRAYGSEHEYLPVLAHDLAYYWMNQGYFAQVMPIFLSLEDRFEHEPGTKIAVRAHIARAAGGIGDRTTFRRYFTETVRMAKEPVYESRISDVFLELAMGASSLGEWDRAEQAAERALEAAQERGQAKVALEAESVLDSVRRGRRVEHVTGERAQVSRSTQAFADQLVEILTTTAVA